MRTVAKEGKREPYGIENGAHRTWCKQAQDMESSFMNFHSRSEPGKGTTRFLRTRNCLIPPVAFCLVAPYRVSKSLSPQGEMCPSLIPGHLAYASPSENCSPQAGYRDSDARRRIEPMSLSFNRGHTVQTTLTPLRVSDRTSKETNEVDTTPTLQAMCT